MSLSSYKVHQVYKALMFINIPAPMDFRYRFLKLLFSDRKYLNFRKRYLKSIGAGIQKFLKLFYNFSVLKLDVLQGRIRLWWKLGALYNLINFITL